jgi:heat shock protein HslJ
MNKKSLKYFAIAIISALSLASCSSLQSASSSTTGKKQTTSSSTGAASSHSTTASAAAENLAGEWYITAAGSVSISEDEDMPYLTFSAADGLFYGSNGCNVINGSYSVSGSTVKFSNVLTTQKYCPDVTYDALITTFLQDGKSANIAYKTSGNQTILTLTDTESHSTLTLCRHNMQFLNGQWQVTDINGKGVNDEEANIFFDVNELKIHGNTGCNFFNGSILIDPAVSNSINFSGMQVTRMSCPKLDQERLMLVALEETATAVKNSDGTISLRNSAGKTVLKLKKVEIAND